MKVYVNWRVSLILFWHSPLSLSVTSTSIWLNELFEKRYVAKASRHSRGHYTKVCNHYEIEESAIHTKTRKREVVQVRQVAMYLAKKHTDSSSSKIGQLIGNKDHATVLHACKIVKDQVEVDKTFKADIEEIEASLKRK